MTACIGRHDDTPPLPEPGLLLCGKHYNDLRGDLRDITTLWPLLDDMLQPGANGTANGGKRIDPPAPCDLDVADITDPRGVTSQQLTSWARVVIEDRQLAPRSLDAEQAARLLTVHLDWLAAQPFVDEVLDEIRTAAHAVRRACRLTRKAPIGSCRAPDPRDPSQDCDGPLYWNDGTMQVRCARCHDTWNEADLISIAHVVEVWVPIGDAAELLGVTTRTINRYAEAGQIRRDRGRVVYSEVSAHIRRGEFA